MLATASRTFYLAIAAHQDAMTTAHITVTDFIERLLQVEVASHCTLKPKACQFLVKTKKKKHTMATVYWVIPTLLTMLTLEKRRGAHESQHQESRRIHPYKVTKLSGLVGTSGELQVSS